MAARLHPALSGRSEIVDLRALSSHELAPLLEEEIGSWRDLLDWDFTKSADLVSRYVDLHVLGGAALLEDGAVTGYAYFVVEENKVLIGDLYVRRGARTTERENALLEAALEILGADAPASRIEAQFMMLAADPDRQFPSGDFGLSVFERNFMRMDLRGASLAEERVRKLSYFERWSDLYQDGAAQAIAAAYAGHVDALINDQYRSAAGARRFIHNIVQYPGCGAFQRHASFAAFEGASGRLCGVSLASLVAPESGHITQICVTPEMKGAGIGHALLRQSLLALQDMGCRTASLTVTAANRNAVELYERVGFRTVKRFPAFVWEGWRRA
jgi:ribosomal protein S18 acetylase RimI-like enzyme